MPKAIVIDTEGKIAFREVNGYEDIHAIVGGYIEGIPFGPDAVAYLNEDGKSLNLTYNLRATILSHAKNYIFANDYIVGNMVILGKLNEKGQADCDDHDVPERFRKELGV